MQAMSLLHRSCALLLGTAVAAACQPKPREQQLGSGTSATAQSSSPPSPSSTAGDDFPTPPPSAPAASDSFACEVDADCTNSCQHGAVNKAWWEAQYPGGEACEDGCTSKGTDPARCEAKQCVAYAHGKPAPECTRKQAPVLSGPGPAHRCNQDSDCTMTCAYGAVNKHWASYGAKRLCKDGCEDQFSEPPHCDSGACVAYLNGKPTSRCSRMSIH